MLGNLLKINYLTLEIWKKRDIGFDLAGDSA
jgi:hypothetical protein